MSEGKAPVPDGSVECGIILAKLETLEEQLAELRRAVEEIKLGRAREAGQLSGATWALARVGAIVVAFLSAAGWIVMNGVPAPLKKLLSP